jgi:hypothetical protein
MDRRLYASGRSVARSVCDLSDGNRREQLGLATGQLDRAPARRAAPEPTSSDRSANANCCSGGRLRRSSARRRATSSSVSNGLTT